MTTDFKTIFFDIDDTLFDRNRAQRKILYLIIRELPDIFAGIDEDKIMKSFLESDHLAMQELYTDGSTDVFRLRRSKIFLQILGLNEDFADKITKIYLKSYPTIDAPVRGAKLVVGDLAKRFQLGIISNGLSDVQYRKLETLGIKHIFDCIVLSEEVGIWKPDTGIFWQATDLLSRNPEDCLYVGDSYEADIVGAKKAGMQACWFNPHGLNVSDVEIRPDFEIRALEEILGILDYV